MRVSQKAPGSAPRDKHTAAKKRHSGCGLSGVRQKQSQSPVIGLTKADIRRLARKAGVKRISIDTYDEAKTALTSFLRTILKDVGVITEGARRMTVMVPDVLLALKRNGRTLYGFGEITSLDQYAVSIRKPVKHTTLQRAAAHVQRHRSQQGPSSSEACSHPALGPSLASRATNRGQDSAEANSMCLESQPDDAQQSTDSLTGSMDMVPATPSPSPQACMIVDEEMREHIQGSVGEYVSKVYKYDPPGSVYKVKDLHSWVVDQYFQRKGLVSCSPEQLHTVLYALEEENHIMISTDDDDLQIRFVM